MIYYHLLAWLSCERTGGITIAKAEVRLDDIIGDMTADELRDMIRRYINHNCKPVDKHYMASCAWSVFNRFPQTNRGVYYMEELYDIKEQFRQELN